MKKQLGQFFTTNSSYILQGFESFVKNKKISDPFAGNQDLLSWAKKNDCEKTIGFDCDKNYVDNKNVFSNDSINNPQKYNFVCTNPPYLHKNKADRNIKANFFSNTNSIFEDLYQVSINSIMDCKEGILIVPLNFLCAENSKKIRALFFEKFKIVKLNIFKEKVFKDTTYNVISFYFKEKKADINEIATTIYPQNKKLILTLKKEYDWQFGGDFIKKIKTTKNKLGITRLTEKHLEPGEHKIELALQNINHKKVFQVSNTSKARLKNNILFLRAIDSKNGKKIQLEDIRNYNVHGLVGKQTSRNLAHIIFQENIPIKEQEELMERFNSELNKNRNEYFSFFLTNFRDNNRKRISFNTAYKFLNYIYYS
jgi:hypothetical protein